MLLIQCASMHSLVSRYEWMLSGAFIFPDGVCQIAGLHRKSAGILLPSLTAGNIRTISIRIYQLQHDRFP